MEAVPKPKVAWVRLATNRTASVGSTAGAVMALSSQSFMTSALSHFQIRVAMEVSSSKPKGSVHYHPKIPV
jgi:hypothetical protein